MNWKMTEQEARDYNAGKPISYKRSIDQEKEKQMIDMPQNVVDNVKDAVSGVEIKKLNVEVEKDGKTYKLDVNEDGVKTEIQ